MEALGKLQGSAQNAIIGSLSEGRQDRSQVAFEHLKQLRLATVCHGLLNHYIIIVTYTVVVWSKVI